MGNSWAVEAEELREDATGTVVVQREGSTGTVVVQGIVDE